MNAIESVDTILRETSLFASLSDDELRELSRLAVSRRVSSDEVLFNEGEQGEHLYVVVSGSVRLSTTDSNGRAQPTALLGKGQAFGEMAVLDSSPRSATAIATEDTTVTRIERSDLERLAAKFPDAQAKILREGIRLVSARLRQSNARFWELARNAMRQKQELTQSRARFLSLVSHELRTPLAIIKSSAQLMLRSPKGTRTRFLDKIVAESNHLAILVDDLITFSLLQSNTALQDRTRCDGAQLLRRVVRDLSPAAGARNVRLTLNVTKEQMRVTADAVLLARAVHHLVDNAIKFSPLSGEVVASLDRDSQGRARFSVIDRGEGIPANRLKSLLEGFVQSQGPLNRDVDGMGIGLSLVDEVVRAHGGHLVVDSTPGLGSTFTILLPAEYEGERDEQTLECNGGQR